MTDFLEMEGTPISTPSHPETSSIIAPPPDRDYLDAVAELYIASFDYYMIAYMHNKFSDYPIGDL